MLFLKESIFGNKESIQKHGIFGTNHYELSWCGYMTPKPLLMMIGISMGGVSAAIAAGTLSVLRPLVESGQIHASLAWTVPLFFTWGISGIMLTMMALGQGATGKVPVTHAISLVGALMFLHTEPYVGANTAILFGILGGIMGMATLTDNETQIRKEFHTLHELFTELKGSVFSQSEAFSILSMGMTHDYKLAIEEGSNMIRVGTYIFGEREY